jgi:hypothetical protein
VKEYHTEFAEIKNQEVTVKRLQEQLEDYEVTTNLLLWLYSFVGPPGTLGSPLGCTLSGTRVSLAMA